MKYWKLYLILPFLQADIWLGAMLGSDDTFFDTSSDVHVQKYWWIEGLNKRIFIGYMLKTMGLFRLPVAVEYTWDSFAQNVGITKVEVEVDYSLRYDWILIARPGIHLGDGFVYLLGSIERAVIYANMTGQNIDNKESVIYPYSHFGMGLSFAVAPQTELMAEVRFSQRTSQKIYSLFLNNNLLDPTDINVHNTQLFIGLSYNF